MTALLPNCRACLSDGQDIALLRATVVDANGVQVDDSQVRE